MTFPEWIIFDLGNVVFDLNPGWIDGLLAHVPPARHQAIRTLLADDFHADKTVYSLNERFQLGEFGTEEFLATVRQAAGVPLTDAELLRIFERIIIGKNAGTEAFIRELPDAVRIACYSNCHDLCWQYLLQAYPEVMAHFSPKISSHIIRIAKPDPRGFAVVLEQLGATPGDCLFVDDRAVNIEGARAAGMRIHHFTGGAGALRRDWLAGAKT